MPSLQVVRAVRNEIPSSYFHFYDRLERISYIHNKPHDSRPSLICIFVKSLLIAIVVNSIVHGTLNTFWVWLYDKFPNFYENEEGVFGFLCILISYQFVMISLMILVFFNQHSQNSFNTILLITFIIVVIVHGTLLFFLNRNFHSSNEKTIALTSLCNIKFFETNCDLWLSLYYFDLFCVFSPVSLIVCILVNYIRWNQCCQRVCTCCCSISFHSNINGNYKTRVRENKSNIFSHDQTENSIFTDFVSNNTNEQNSSTQATQQTQQTLPETELVPTSSSGVYAVRGTSADYFGKAMIRTYLAFGIGLLLLIFSLVYCFLVTQPIMSLKQSYYVMFFILCFYKHILKNIARNVDKLIVDDYEIRGKYNDYHYWKYYVSSELVIELSCDLLYYYFYYFYFLNELANLSDYHLYLEISSIHLSSEMFVSFLKFSKLYFNFSLKMKNFIESKITFVAKLQKRYRLKDDSNFDEWRTRHSIDTSLKIFSVFISLTLILMSAFVLGKNGFGLSNSKDYYQGIMLCFTSFFIDILYFLMFFLINLLYSDFNVWKPCLTIFDTNHKAMLCLFVISAILNCSFSLF